MGGKQLDVWLDDKSKKSNFARMLAHIITSIDRHTAAKAKSEAAAKTKIQVQTEIGIGSGDEAKEQQEQEEEVEALSAPLIVDHVDSEADTDNDMSVPATPTMVRKKSNKQRYESTEARDEILRDAAKRQQSLETLREADGGLIKFLSKYLKSKIVEKMWSKLDAQQQGHVGVASLPDLIAFVVILWKVKVHQQKTKSKGKPQMDNKAVRAQMEHLAVWIANAFVFDEQGEFKLTQQMFQDNFADWCQQYLDA